MNAESSTVPCRTVGEWALHSERAYAEPFLDVMVDATFTGPTGETFVMPAFYDGQGTWRIRFCPGEAGTWSYRFCSRPADPALAGPQVRHLILPPSFPPTHAHRFPARLEPSPSRPAGGFAPQRDYRFSAR